ncbi:hypothetical protein DRJ17_05855 [Candidatus Woesearchaeota archaeon]|nr:MAG: hypothetical protein DRJ17_05855 [Candidatus Woesearchaeota archaeon]
MPWERFKRFISYYLDCIKEDEGHGSRFFLNDEGKKFITLPIDTEWGLSGGETLLVDLTGDNSRFAAELRQRRATSSLFYGYPLYIDWIERSRNGWTGGFGIPVFLQAVENDLVGTELEIWLENQWPVINLQYLKKLSRTPEEKRNLLKDIGLLETVDEPPENALANLVRNHNRWSLGIDMVETLNPEEIIGVPPVSQLNKGGIYNRAVLVIGERSPYTRGLEYELPLLRDKADNEGLNNSALRLFFSDDTIAMTNKQTDANKQPIIEVVPLNDEQRDAVRSAFENDLTVVTGPPGTGKSQVVISVIANAHLRGERVLFTSRNNKAVDVVESRLNALSQIPLVIRVGRRSGERNLRKELVEFVSRVLSISVSDEDRYVLNETRKKVEELIKNRDKLWYDLEIVRKKRNTVDELDRLVEDGLDNLPEEVADVIMNSEIYPSISDPTPILQLIDEQLSADKGLLQSIYLWFRRKKDLRKISSYLDSISNHFDIFGKSPEEVSYHELNKLNEYFNEVKRRYEFLKIFMKYKDYYKGLISADTTAQFAKLLASIEEKLWDFCNQFIAAYGKMLPERLDPETRRALGEFRATMERLAGDQVGGRTYARLMRQLERIFQRVSRVLPAWCVTNLSANGSLPLGSCLFDLLVIDEASQCDIPSALPLLYRAKRVMIIGDPNQLRHITSLSELRDQQLQSKYGLTDTSDQPFTFNINSLYDLAATCAGEAKVISLREHFRSHTDIIEFSNHNWYNGTLKMCTDYRRLKSDSGYSLGIRWTDVKGAVRRPSSGGAINEKEAKEVVKELKSLIIDRGFRGTVGIVTPFRAQTNRIRDLVNETINLSYLLTSDLIVDTAHGFQGDERDVILFSPCIGEKMPRGAKYFLASTGNLFNVAITRARSVLHVIGNKSACNNCGVKHIEEFVSYVNRIESEPTLTFGSEEDIGYWERPFYEALLKAGIKPMPQYREHQYKLDFAIKEGDFWLDIEIDGELYHKEWDGSRCRRDVIRDLRLTALGWRVKRFWVYQVRDDMDACVQEVVSLIVNRSHM